MGKYTCEICGTHFTQKPLYQKHTKTPCLANTMISIDPPPISNESLLKELLETHSIRETAQKLNVAPGTIQRWEELKHVPPQYRFDLFRLLSKDVNYSEYSSSEKDQFFTPRDLVEKCWDTFREKLPDLLIEDYVFIEPSAGDGSFLSILPMHGTIALDIEPRQQAILKQDYLSWEPADKTKKYIVFGNPPFGLRGHIALQFINHSLSFADYVCFILPQLFESDGKGSPRKRVEGYHLIHSEKLSAPFYTPDATEVNINAVFQIWSKHTSNSLYSIETYSQDVLKVYSLSDGGTASTTRNKKMANKCDIYLPSTCFGKENMKVYSSFEELPNRKGYGVVFMQDKEAMVEKSKRVDWSRVSFLSTNSAYNLRTSLIYQTLIPNSVE
jgi:transcriptional regulator with XRE-family HTH domain